MLRVLYTIITLTGLCNPVSSQLPEKHSNALNLKSVYTQQSDKILQLPMAGYPFKYYWVDILCAVIF